MMRQTHHNVKRNDALGAFAKLMHGAHTFAMGIKHLRNAKGWNQRDLAERVGVDQSTIQRAEAMKTGVSIQIYMAIAEALEAELHDLFADERTPDELRIISAYRTAGPEGRRMWEKLASEAEGQEQPLEK